MIIQAIKNLLKKNISITILLILTILLVVLLGILPAQILAYIIDYSLNVADVSIEGGNNFWGFLSVFGILGLAIIYALILITNSIFDFLKDLMLVFLGQGLTKEIRSLMAKKLIRINSLFFSNNDSGYITSSFVNDVEAINKIFSEGIINIIIDLFKIIGIIISMFIFSIQLGLVTLIVIPIIYVVTRIIQRKMMRAQMHSRKMIAKVNNHISETLKNERMIKFYSKEIFMENKYEEYLEDNFVAVEKSNYCDSIHPAIVNFLKACVVTTVVLLSTPHNNLLGLSVGMIAGATELIATLFKPIENLGVEIQSVVKAVAGIKRVGQYDKQIDDDKKDDIGLSDIIKNRENIKISFNDLGFSYNSDVKVLEDINIDINALEKVTFIGRTGVGKTTTFKLIMGLLKPSHGNITINGIDVYKIPDGIKSRLFGYVSQSCNLINGSFYDQISLGDETITKEMVIESLRFVGLMDYINEFSNGIDNKCSSGMLSQGQKQLISICRAIVTNPPILLLDEMTANLDSLTEKKIIDVLEKASYSRTIISVSHRLSSMLSADKIVYLEEGKVKNYGNPKVLLEEDEWFKNHLRLEQLWDNK